MRLTRMLVIGAVLLALPAALLVASMLPAPLEPDGRWAAALPRALPPATPPAEMALFQVPTGVIPRIAAFAYRGGSLRDKRNFAMTAVLVRHPGGDLLIDTGLGRDVDAQLGQLPYGFRAVTHPQGKLPAADQLRARGYDLAKLRAIVLTHAHWDHISGAPDFPRTPIWVPAAERRYIADGGVVMEPARGVPATRYREYTFADKPYLGFPRSHDVYGDGAIVIVPAPGHTPGSVIVFVSLPAGQRYALVGDLAWQREGIHERAERPWLMRTLVDRDPAAVRDGLLHMFAIAQRFPSLRQVPAHDARGFAGMPTLDRL